MNKLKFFFWDMTHNVWFSIKVSYEASKFYFLLKCIILISTTLIPLLTFYLWKLILDGITNFDASKQKVIPALVIYLSLMLLTYLASRFNDYINNRYYDELILYMENIMIEKTSRMDLSFFDSASMGDKVAHARNNFGVINDMTWLVFDIISEIINIVATSIIISMYNIWIGIATVILLIPFMIFNKKHTEKMLKMQKKLTRDNHKKGYFAGVFFDNNIQFEVKLYSIGDWFIKQYKDIWSKLYKINKREDIRYNIINTFILIINVSSELLVLIVSVLGVIAGKIGIGDLQYNLNIVNRLRTQTVSLMNDVNSFLVNNTRLDELQEFIKLQPEIEKTGNLIPSSNPKIEFCNVFFRYPNSEKFVLENCSFIIEPKEKIGLIGLNGSGKSTIVKLMFRFYDLEAGVIKIDGVDIKEYDVYKLRKVFGVLFQDYVTYCLPFREIIALSDFSERNNDEKLKKACDISGISNVIKDWGQGFDCILGRYYANDGKDLSGGQWQLVGLARAYFKDSDYIILDEPSAVLDPISEDRIFEQLYHLSKDKSCVTISHRLSNITLADKILVLEDGYIIEQGSHFELLKQNGKYTHLFNLQASKYV